VGSALNLTPVLRSSSERSGGSIAAATAAAAASGSVSAGHTPTGSMLFTPGGDAVDGLLFHQQHTQMMLAQAYGEAAAASGLEAPTLRRASAGRPSLVSPVGGGTSMHSSGADVVTARSDGGVSDGIGGMLLPLGSGLRPGASTGSSTVTLPGGASVATTYTGSSGGGSGARPALASPVAPHFGLGVSSRSSRGGALGGGALAAAGASVLADVSGSRSSGLASPPGSSRRVLP